MKTKQLLTIVMTIAVTAITMKISDMRHLGSIQEIAESIENAGINNDNTTYLYYAYRLYDVHEDIRKADSQAGLENLSAKTRSLRGIIKGEEGFSSNLKFVTDVLKVDKNPNTINLDASGLIRASIRGTGVGANFSTIDPLELMYSMLNTQQRDLTKQLLTESSDLKSRLESLENKEGFKELNMELNLKVNPLGSLNETLSILENHRGLLNQPELRNIGKIKRGISGLENKGVVKKITEQIEKTEGIGNE